jgi:hypothetical protein
MIAMPDQPDESTGRKSRGRAIRVERRWSVTDWLIDKVEHYALPVIGTALVAVWRKATWQMVAFVFLWLSGVASLTWPTIHAWWAKYRTGEGPERKPEIAQFVIGCLLFFAFIVLWFAFPEDMNEMADLLFTPTRRTFFVLAVIAAVCAVLLFVAAATTPTAVSEAVATSESQPAAPETAAPKPTAESSTGETREALEAERNTLRKQASAANRDNKIFRTLAQQMRESNTAGPIQRAALDYWIEEFGALSRKMMSTDAEFDSWLKDVEQQKSAARDFFIGLFNHPVLTNAFFDGKQQFTTGRRFENRYDDRHNLKLNELAALIDWLKRERDKIPPDATEQSASGEVMDVQASKLWHARTIAEGDYAKQAREVMDKGDRTLAMKAYDIAIGLLDSHMSIPVKSEAELDFWLLWLEQKRLVNDVLSQMLRVTGWGLENPPPPDRELKQFRAFNDRHNQALNDIEYHLARLRTQLAELEANAAAE